MSGDEKSRKYLLTVEAAEYVRLAARTLEEYRVKGGGPKFYRVGPGKRAICLYTHEDLDAWIQKGGAQ